MNVIKCYDTDYIDFLIASPELFSCTEAAKVQPEAIFPPAHNSFTRRLLLLEPDPEPLWREARPLVPRTGGLLVLDDSTLDKPYARSIDLVTRHRSGKHHAVVLGINLRTSLWTDGDRHIPCDYRFYDKGTDGLTKNDHFGAMLGAAKERGFAPDCVAFDSWYSGLENLKLIRGLGWRWLTRLKVNRRVNLDRQGNKAVGATAIETGGTIVHREGYGLIRVFRIVSRGGDTEHWATDDLAMDEMTRLSLAERTWAIENYHRGLKQCCGVGRCQARAGRAQRNHIGMAIRAFLRPERRHFYATGISWYEARARIVRGAI
ncbi:IS701 family transposase [Tautonia plasticadhaerens]